MAFYELDSTESWPKDIRHLLDGAIRGDQLDRHIQLKPMLW
jgi:hypothetical protein